MECWKRSAANASGQSTTRCPHGELQGYDAAMRRFRDLCMGMRRALSGNANGKRNSEPHD